MRYPFSSRRCCGSLLILLSLVSAGCYRRVSYASPQGRRVEVVNLGFDTRIGSLTAQTEEGSLQIEDLDESARVAALLTELAGQALRPLPQGGGR